MTPKFLLRGEPFPEDVLARLMEIPVEEHAGIIEGSDFTWRLGYINVLSDEDYDRLRQGLRASYNEPDTGDQVFWGWLDPLGGWDRETIKNEIRDAIERATPLPDAVMDFHVFDRMTGEYGHPLEKGKPTNWGEWPALDVMQARLANLYSSSEINPRDPRGYGLGRLLTPEEQTRAGCERQSDTYLSNLYDPDSSRDDVVLDLEGKLIGSTVKEPWSYKGRGIHPVEDGRRGDAWHISGIHPFIRWTFGREPANPTIEWWVYGEVMEVYQDDWKQNQSYVLKEHPDLGKPGNDFDPNASPRKLLGRFFPVDIRASVALDDFDEWVEAVHGRKLSFFEALDIAIKWAEAQEYAMGAGPKPDWLEVGALPPKEKAPEKDIPLIQGRPMTGNGLAIWHKYRGEHLAAGGTDADFPIGQCVEWINSLDECDVAALNFHSQKPGDADFFSRQRTGLNVRGDLDFPWAVDKVVDWQKLLDEAYAAIAPANLQGTNWPGEVYIRYFDAQGDTGSGMRENDKRLLAAIHEKKDWDRATKPTVPDGYDIRFRKVGLIREGRHKYRISMEFIFGPPGATENDLEVATKLFDRWAVSVPGFKTLDPGDIVMAGQSARGDTVLLPPNHDSKDGFYVTNLWIERSEGQGIHTVTVAAEKGEDVLVSLDHEFAIVPIPGVGEDRIGTPDEYRKAVPEVPIDEAETKDIPQAPAAAVGDGDRLDGEPDAGGVDRADPVGSGDAALEAGPKQPEAPAQPAPLDVAAVKEEIAEAVADKVTARILEALRADKEA